MLAQHSSLLHTLYYLPALLFAAIGYARVIQFGYQLLGDGL
jgi:hypothetical protein